MQTQKKIVFPRRISRPRYFANRPWRAKRFTALKAPPTGQTRLKSTFHRMHHFSSMKTYGMHAAGHAWRYVTSDASSCRDNFIFPDGRSEAETARETAIRHADSRKTVIYVAAVQEDIEYKVKKKREKNLYPTRTNVCAGAIAARGWLKSTGKPLNENPYDTTSGL